MASVASSSSRPAVGRARSNTTTTGFQPLALTQPASSVRPSQISIRSPPPHGLTLIYAPAGDRALPVPSGHYLTSTGPPEPSLLPLCQRWRPHPNLPTARSSLSGTPRRSTNSGYEEESQGGLSVPVQYRCFRTAGPAEKELAQSELDLSFLRRLQSQVRSTE